MAKRQDSAKSGGLSQRQLRVGELVRRALSDVLIRGEAHGLGMQSSSITVSEVRMSPDLRQAVAYVMPLGGRGEAEALEALAEARGEIRRAVMRRVHLKFSPDFQFRLDETFDQYDRTREMLSRDEVARDLRDEDED
ncbi:MAG: 30S ribosome-binding factor RbfA [Pseudomonadota bacterium]